MTTSTAAITAPPLARSATSAPSRGTVLLWQSVRTLGPAIVCLVLLWLLVAFALPALSEEIARRTRPYLVGLGLSTLGAVLLGAMSVGLDREQGSRWLRGLPTRWPSLVAVKLLAGLAAAILLAVVMTWPVAALIGERGRLGVPSQMGGAAVFTLPVVTAAAGYVFGLFGAALTGGVVSGVLLGLASVIAGPLTISLIAEAAGLGEFWRSADDFPLYAAASLAAGIGIWKALVPPASRGNAAIGPVASGQRRRLMMRVPALSPASRSLAWRESLPAGWYLLAGTVLMALLLTLLARNWRMNGWNVTGLLNIAALVVTGLMTALAGVLSAMTDGAATTRLFQSRRGVSGTRVWEVKSAVWLLTCVGLLAAGQVTAFTIGGFFDGNRINPLYVGPPNPVMAVWAVVAVVALGLAMFFAGQAAAVWIGSRPIGLIAGLTAGLLTFIGGVYLMSHLAPALPIVVAAAAAGVCGLRGFQDAWNERRLTLALASRRTLAVVGSVVLLAFLTRWTRLASVPDIEPLTRPADLAVVEAPRVGVSSAVSVPEGATSRGRAMDQWVRLEHSVTGDEVVDTAVLRWRDVLSRLEDGETPYLGDSESPRMATAELLWDARRHWDAGDDAEGWRSWRDAARLASELGDPRFGIRAVEAGWVARSWAAEELTARLVRGEVKPEELDRAAEILRDDRPDPAIDVRLAAWIEAERVLSREWSTSDGWLERWLLAEDELLRRRARYMAETVNRHSGHVASWAPMPVGTFTGQPMELIQVGPLRDLSSIVLCNFDEHIRSLGGVPEAWDQATRLVEIARQR